MAVHTPAPPPPPPPPPHPPVFDWLHSLDFWTAAGTCLLAAATGALILIGLAQISALKRQNRRWETLAACQRYTFDPILDTCLRTLRDTKNLGKFDNNEKALRLEIITVINYLEGLAVGIFQGLYIEDLVRDYLETVIIGHVDEYLKDGMPKKIDFDVKDFPYVLALYARWTEISRPRFREREWRLPWRRSR
jgi:hypothetical protein